MALEAAPHQGSVLVAHLRGTRQREGDQQGLEVLLFSSRLEPTYPRVGNAVQLDVWAAHIQLHEGAMQR